MLKTLDKKIKLDVYVTLIATLISVIFITASYIFIDFSDKILSILVIILPTIYIVGGLIVRGILQKELDEQRDGYDEAMQEISEGINSMSKEIQLLKFKNNYLEKEKKELNSKIKELMK